MGILSMKAYFLEYLRETSGYYDEHGDYVQGSHEWVDLGKCDAVPAGRNNTIQLPDGVTDTFSFTISNLPRNCREFHKGERIRLTALGREKIELEVKGFARYQLQCKIWA